MSLSDAFNELHSLLEELIALLQEGHETYWCHYMQRGMGLVRKQHLSGATYVLGAYGGVNTFSDLKLAPRSSLAHHLGNERDTRVVANKYAALNRRLIVVRTQIFDCANSITVATARGNR